MYGELLIKWIARSIRRCRKELKTAIADIVIVFYERVRNINQNTYYQNVKTFYQA